MTRAKVVFWLVTTLGTVAGVIAGVAYYRNHYGDWRVGAYAVAIAVGVIAGSVLLAGICGWLAKPLPPSEGTTGTPPMPKSTDATTATPTRVTRPVDAPNSYGHKNLVDYGTTNLIDILSMLGSIGAGAFLLQYHSAGSSATGTSWFEIIGHGMGIYFIAKGLFIGRTTYLQADARNKLAQIVELLEHEAEDRKNVLEESPAG